MRIAWAMTIDPDGAMHDWVDAPPGVELVRVPTQELVHLVGPVGLGDLLVDLCRCERPAALILHPPYDHLTPAAAAAIRASGTALVAYAFDEEIFPASPELTALYDRYLTVHDVPWATRPLEALPEAELQHDVCLVGRATLGRGLVVSALRGAGLRVATRGAGWPEGWVTRAEMEALYAASAVVLTTGDWEGEAVPMVKHRLLETAMLGCFQIAQDAPDLRRYFPAEEVPAYRSTAELVAAVKRALADTVSRRVAGRRARERALEEHTWAQRLPRLLDGLDLLDRPGERSPCLDLGLRALASRAEVSGRLAAAGALYGELLARHPGDFFATLGLGRTLRDRGDRAAAVPHLRRATVHTDHPPAARTLRLALPSQGVGVGLGALGRFPAALEPTALLVATLVELGQADEAAAALDAVEDPVLAEALVAALELGDDAPEPVRAALARLRPSRARS